MSINVTVVGSTGVSTSIASSDQIVVAVGGTLANTPLTALQVTAGANITITTTSGVYTFIGPDVPVASVNGQTGAVVLTLANLTAAAASHTHVMSDITDLAYPVNVVNGQTGTVLLTSTDVSAASAVHTHVASEITNLTSVANVVSVNGQTGVAVLNSTNVSAASAVHTHVMADVTDLAFPVSSVNGYTGVVSLTTADLTAAAASHTHLMSDITDLAYPVNVVNGQTGTVLLTSTDVSAASAVHTHVASEITNLTAVANVISVNGQTGVAVLNSTNVSAASAVHTHVMADVTDLAFPVSSVNGYTGTVSLTITDLTAASASHTHTASEVTDLTSVANVVSVNGITGTPSIVAGSGITVSTSGSSITIEAAAGGTASGASLSDALPQALGSPTAGISGLASRSDHAHAMPSAADVGAAAIGHTHLMSDVTDLAFPVNSVNGYTGTVSLTSVDVSAASAVHTHVMADVTDLAFPVSSVNGYTGTVSLTITDLTAAAASHTHSRSEVTDLTASDIVFSPYRVLFSNVYSNLADLPSATDNHGMFAHVHATGRAYYAHAGSWVPLANQNDVSVTSVNGYTGTVSLTSADITAAAASHTHAASEVTDLASVANVVSINGQTGVVALTAADLTAAAASHTHTASEVTDLTSVANVVSINGYTGVVALTAADLTAAAASHTHAASEVTDLTSVANVISVNGQTGVVTIALGDALPSHGGNATNVLTTDGTAASWATRYSVVEPVLVAGTGMSFSKDSSAGSITIEAAGGIVGSTAASVSTKALSADQDDYDAGVADIVRLTPSANVTLTGLAGGSDGVVRVLYNVGTHAVTLSSGNTNSVETNRFSIVSGNAVLSEGDSSSVWYDGTSQRWRVLEDQITGGSGGSGGGIAMSYLFG